MINQLVNEFYTRFLFKIDALPQDVLLPLKTATTFLNNFISDIMEFLISEGVKVPIKPPMETNYQGNYRLLLFRKAVKAENNTRTTKLAVQPAGGSHHPRKFMGVLGGIPSTQMHVLDSSFK